MKGLVLPIIISVILPGVTAQTQCNLLNAHDLCLHNLFNNLGSQGEPYLCINNGLTIASKCISDVAAACVGVYPKTFLAQFHNEVQSEKLITAACKQNDVLMNKTKCISTTYPSVGMCLNGPDQTLANAVKNLTPKDYNKIMSAVCTYFNGASACIAKFGTCGPGISDVAVSMFEALSPTSCPGAGVVHSISLLCLLVSLFFNKIIS